MFEYIKASEIVGDLLVNLSNFCARLWMGVKCILKNGLYISTLKLL